jgi:hypothetical protein
MSRFRNITEMPSEGNGLYSDAGVYDVYIEEHCGGLGVPADFNLMPTIGNYLFDNNNENFDGGIERTILAGDIAIIQIKVKAK